MRILASIWVDEEEIPEEVAAWPVEQWGTAEIGFLLMDGDGGPHWVEYVQQVNENAE